MSGGQGDARGKGGAARYSQSGLDHLHPAPQASLEAGKSMLVASFDSNSQPRQRHAAERQQREPSYSREVASGSTSGAGTGSQSSARNAEPRTETPTLASKTSSSGYTPASAAALKDVGATVRPQEMQQKIRDQETQARIQQGRERQTLVQAQIQDERAKSKERERQMQAQIQEEREKNTRSPRAQQTGRMIMR